MEYHTLSNIFPMMSDEEFESLKGDIAVNGLLEPIWTYQNQIIDGRNRYKACSELGVEPTFREWNGKGSLVAFIVSLNLHRRHLNESQRAMIAARLANLKHGDNQFTMDTEISVSITEAAEMLSISSDLVGMAKKVTEQGTEELQDAVTSGEVAVSTAAEVATLPEDEQVAIVAQGEKEIIAAANKIKKERKERKKKEKEQRRLELIEIARAQQPLFVETFQLIVGDLANEMKNLEPGSVDVIITDPPYPKEYLPLYETLACEAKRVLKPGGLAVVMIGQSYLPDILAMMTKHLTYHWVGAYMTPGASTQLWERKVLTQWKPLLIFSNGDYTGEWIYDVTKSESPDKDNHEWGQSISGMEDIVKRFSQTNELILDPFCGAGTTGVVALKLDRRFIGIDIDKSAIEISTGRIAEVLNDKGNISVSIRQGVFAESSS